MRKLTEGWGEVKWGEKEGELKEIESSRTEQEREVVDTYAGLFIGG